MVDTKSDRCYGMECVWFVKPGHSVVNKAISKNHQNFAHNNNSYYYYYIPHTNIESSKKYKNNIIYMLSLFLSVLSLLEIYVYCGHRYVLKSLLHKNSLFNTDGNASGPT